MSEPADPASVLHDLPVALWGQLLAAVRRAADRLPEGQLPALLRPYAGWRSDRLAHPRPRRAVAEALATDSRLRDAVGRALPAPLWDAAEHADPARLAATHGAEAAVAGLVARGRWDALAVVAADAAPRSTNRPPSASEPGPRSTGEAAAQLGQLRRERDEARRRADAAEERARRLLAGLEQQQATAEGLRDEVERVRRELADERRRGRDRLARLRRRAAAAEARAAAASGVTGEVASRLEALAAELRSAAEPGAGAGPGTAAEPGAGGAPAAAAGAGDQHCEPGQAAVLPRGAPAAAPGRPCRLPAGLTGQEPEAVRALLQVPRLQVVLDGYNVVKDVEGVPLASLADQRAWLERLAAAVVARWGTSVTLVFDGDGERLVARAPARGVRTIFTPAGEQADDRIRALVADLDPDVPVAVVTSDRQVRDDCAELGADLVASGLFLRAVT